MAKRMAKISIEIIISGVKASSKAAKAKYEIMAIMK